MASLTTSSTFWWLMGMMSAPRSEETSADLAQHLRLLDDRGLARFDGYLAAVTELLEGAQLVDDGEVLYEGDARRRAVVALLAQGRRSVQGALEPGRLTVLLPGGHELEFFDALAAAHVPWVDPSWLGGGGGLDMGVPDPAAYRWAGLALTERLNADDAWRAWWASSGRDHLHLYPFTTPHPGVEVRVRRRRASIDVEMEFDAAPLHSTDRQELADLAVEHVRCQIDVAQDRLRLGTPPPWPVLPPVPDDLSSFDPVAPEITRDELRSAMITGSGFGPDVIDEVVGRLSFG